MDDFYMTETNGPRYWNGKRWVGGPAAWIHVINENGGWIPHHMKFGMKVVSGVIDEMNKEAEKPNLKPVK